jgi:hypothetical protein
VSRRDTHRVTKYFVKLSKECLSRRSSGGHQDFPLMTGKGECARLGLILSPKAQRIAQP